jgi:hypothetical protein
LYSSANSAESTSPVSMSTASSSVEGAITLSEIWVVGLYQYSFVLLSQRTITGMYPMARTPNLAGAPAALFALIHSTT